MDRHMAAALDDYITGHGGEDQFADEETALTTLTRDQLLALLDVVMGEHRYDVARMIVDELEQRGAPQA